MSLPVLDLSLFTDGTIDQRHNFTSKLLASLTDHGFVKLINHNVSDSKVAELFQWSREFFRIPLAKRASVANVPGPNPQRGWSAVGAENAATLYTKGFLNGEVAADLRDAREHFDWASKSDIEYPNRWPQKDALPGFREQMEDTFALLEETSLTIMEALEVALQLPYGTFLSKITQEKNASEMRLLHYPELDVKEVIGGKINRIWPHFDLGVITLLFQDGVGGLEFEDRESPGSFQKVDVGRQADMVVNVSETLQRWTNNRLPAGLHRVTLPKSMENQEEGTLPERYSITYFCKADRDASVGPLQEFLKQSTPLYEEMTAIQYHRQRLQTAY